MNKADRARIRTMKIAAAPPIQTATVPPAEPKPPKVKAKDQGPLITHVCGHTSPVKRHAAHTCPACGDNNRQEQTRKNREKQEKRKQERQVLSDSG